MMPENEAWGQVFDMSGFISPVSRVYVSQWSTLFKVVGCCMLTSSGPLFGFTSLTCSSLSSGNFELKATEIPEEQEGNSGTGQDLKLGLISVMLVASGSLGE